MTKFENKDSFLDLDDVNGMPFDEYINFDSKKYGGQSSSSLDKEENLEYLNFMVWYPDYENCPLPYGVEYAYVSDTYLNKFLSDVTPIRAYLLNRYRKWDAPFDEKEDWPLDIPVVSNCELIRETSDFIWNFDTKREAYDFILKNVAYLSPTFRLRMLQDDIEILAKSNSTSNEYYYFYYDQDNSDCSIGKFLTDDPEDAVIKEFDRYVNYHCDFRHKVGPAELLPLKIFDITRKW